MDFDDIDGYVDDLFNQYDEEEYSSDWIYPQDDNPSDWENWPSYPAGRDAYTEAIEWTNACIKMGTDPESGLHDLPYIPWDERYDGNAQCSDPDVPIQNHRQGAPLVGAWSVSVGANPTGLEVAGAMLLLGLAMLMIFWLGG